MKHFNYLVYFKHTICDVQICAILLDANGEDLSSFDRWYSTAGTPTVEVVSQSHDEASQTYSLTLRQSVPTIPGGSAEQKSLPLPIPVTIGLLHPVSGHH